MKDWSLFILGLVIGILLIVLTHRNGYINLSSDAEDSLRTQLTRLQLEYKRLQGSYMHKSHQVDILLDERDGKNKEVVTAKKERDAARRALRKDKSIRYSAPEVDSALMYRYLSYTDKRDTLMDLPVATGSDIINDLRKSDLKDTLIARQEQVIFADSLKDLTQTALVDSLRSMDSTAVAQRSNLQTQNTKLDSALTARTGERDDASKDRDRFKKQRNISLWVNLAQLLLNLIPK